jgi:hypothetical protein
MNQRLAAAALSIAFTVAACSRNEIHSRLVGTWEEVADEEFREKTKAWVHEHYAAKQIQDHQPQPTNPAVPADGESPLRYVFAPDGTTVLIGTLLGHDFEKTGRWILLEENANRTTIDIIDQGPNHLGEEWRRTFVFEEPDLIREEGGTLGVSRYRRVK